MLVGRCSRELSGRELQRKSVKKIFKHTKIASMAEQSKLVGRLVFVCDPLR